MLFVLGGSSVQPFLWRLLQLPWWSSLRDEPPLLNRKAPDGEFGDPRPLSSRSGFAEERACRRTRRQHTLTYAAIASILGLMFGATLVLLDHWPFTNFSHGELRCEDAGAVVIRIAGKDYAVNGMASLRYAPVQRIWNKIYYPNMDIDRLIVRGLTLCDWTGQLASSGRVAGR